MPDDNHDKPKTTLTLGSSTLHLSGGKTPAVPAPGAIKKRKPGGGVQVEVVGAKRRTGQAASSAAAPSFGAASGLTPKEQEARLRALKLSEEQAELTRAKEA